MEDVGSNSSYVSLLQETRMLRAFCFGVWTQEVAVLRCTSGLWCWRVLSALAFPPLISSGFIPWHPLPASSPLFRTQRLAEMQPAELGFGMQCAQARQG